MPLRIWVWSGLLVLALGIGFVVLTSTVPPDALERDAPAVEARAPDLATPPLVAAAPGSPALAAVPAETRAGVTVGADGVARADIPVLVDPVSVPDAGVQADLVAYAELRRAVLPLRDGLATLESIEVEGRRITFFYRVDINLRLYTLPRSQVPLLPTLDGWLCDGSVCFEFHRNAAVVGPCRSDVVPLLDRGAVAVYVYRDIGYLPMATLPVTAADCTAPAPPSPDGR